MVVRSGSVYFGASQFKKFLFLHCFQSFGPGQSSQTGPQLLQPPSPIPIKPATFGVRHNHSIMPQKLDIKMREPALVNSETGSCFDATEVDLVKVSRPSSVSNSTGFSFLGAMLHKTVLGSLRFSRDPPPSPLQSPPSYPMS